ncbi:L,D-transpeptidase family protein [Acetobacter peroxydans]|uniref:L,D-transpeptidase family protein n=1 Tax=Acetobacter peroxydans TaxID=104098 RepID=UPI0023530607|nr:L,D-transpeptidase family protein [Acetobacter peroxydans]MCH4143557.1 L,D-transpeptidase family protein [Acetobacter peroxydans]MCI1394533.1 L,D-transpeptidase family protein [Acetobacter peroxydans]MCI1411387.1 L,D-transpeptidase family protein [Acetobacter peroxydans]MCI1439742.1 L,D-transpeptidase family protein [Acetobacter peroxydans]MCI1566484.1 L,D-transpeptidase family protein [Acetobacter peroxydans]
MMIHIYAGADSLSDARLHCGHNIMKARIGQNGLTEHKREGDLCSPTGIYPLRRVFYRADRIARPVTTLPLVPLAPTDGWCDDPASPDYNRLVTLPHPARHERLWRDDHVYDLIVVIGYNDEPARSGAGSAIFMHLQRADLAPTEGCVALTEKDLRTVLAARAQAITIHPQGVQA